MTPLLSKSRPTWYTESPTPAQLCLGQHQFLNPDPSPKRKRGLVSIVQHFSRSAELPAVIGWFGYISPDTGLPCHKPLSSTYHHSLQTYLCITIQTNWSPTSLANQYQQLAHYARMYRMYQIPDTSLERILGSILGQYQILLLAIHNVKIMYLSFRCGHSKWYSQPWRGGLKDAEF